MPNWISDVQHKAYDEGYTEAIEKAIEWLVYNDHGEAADGLKRYWEEVREATSGVA